MWDRYIRAARAARAYRSRVAPSVHYKLYLLRAAAVGQEPWMSTWEGPTP